MALVNEKAVISDGGSGGSGGGNSVDLSGLIRASEKGIINGVATLNSEGKVPLDQLPLSNSAFYLLDYDPEHYTDTTPLLINEFELDSGEFDAATCTIKPNNVQHVNAGDNSVIQYSAIKIKLDRELSFNIDFSIDENQNNSFSILALGESTSRINLYDFLATLMVPGANYSSSSYYFASFSTDAVKSMMERAPDSMNTAFSVAAGDRISFHVMDGIDYMYSATGANDYNSLMTMLDILAAGNKEAKELIEAMLTQKIGVLKINGSETYQPLLYLNNFDFYLVLSNKLNFDYSVGEYVGLSDITSDEMTFNFSGQRKTVNLPPNLADGTYLKILKYCQINGINLSGNDFIQVYAGNQFITHKQ